MPANKEIKFHYLVRGILFADGKVLLAHQKAADNTFLPGGHVGLGERAETALIREIEEETGQKATVKKFIGAVEHIWTEGDQVQHEVDLIFELAVSGLNADTTVQSQEEHLEFIWAEALDLKRLNLLPPQMIELLTTWESNYCGFWGTPAAELA